MQPRDGVTAALVIGILVLATFSAFEYTTIQSLEGQMAREASVAEIVYNIPGVAIPVPCCPRLSASIVVGQYLFNDSTFSPVSAFTAKGVSYPAENGVMLLFKVAPLSAPNDIENATFVWANSFNESAPIPSNSSIFGGSVDFHWYTLGGLLYMHIETT